MSFYIWSAFIPLEQPDIQAYQVQRRTTMAASTAPIAAPIAAPRRKVISGHGQFNEAKLATSGRTKLALFPVPEGMTLTFYAPPGAALDNELANHIEQGNSVEAKDVEMRAIDGPKITNVPTPYPYVFSAATASPIDFTVGPPTFPMKGDPYTVTESSALRTIVSSLKEDGVTDIHYACCGTGYSDSPGFRDLFLHRGWYVRLKK